MSWLGRTPRQWGVLAAIWLFFSITIALIVSPWWILAFIALAGVEVVVRYIGWKREQRSGA